MLLTGQLILSRIEENIEKIKNYGVKKIGLFGSYAQNNQDCDSDIDLIVEFNKEQKTFDNYMELKFFLEDLFARKVDLVIAETIKPDLKSEITGSVKYAKGA
ncbi:MAG: nucleotidyltransferase [Dethiobacter sp.]|jgi:predicted nucleotidyltransferase|nr:MAG: nucleotidyltransferase [Dethiobacter sp.]